MRVFRCDSCEAEIAEAKVLVSWDYGNAGITVQPLAKSRTDHGRQDHYCSIACFGRRLAVKFADFGIDEKGGGK